MLMFFFFNDTATTEIYTLSLHDALPISRAETVLGSALAGERREGLEIFTKVYWPTGPGRHNDHGLSRKHIMESIDGRSEEHTSELQSRQYLVCRLLLEKKKTMKCSE